MKLMFPDPVWLYIDMPDRAQAMSIVREMRAVTLTVMVGPRFFLANGPLGVRCFLEAGVERLMLDARYTGSSRQIWQLSYEAARQNLCAITVSSLVGTRSLGYALAAAETAHAHNTAYHRPKIFATPPSPELRTDELRTQLMQRCSRRQYLQDLLQQSLDIKLDGLFVHPRDVPPLRRVSRKLPFIVCAEKLAANYTESDDDKKLCGVTESFKLGASHVVFDTTLLKNTDVSWAADMLRKEIEPLMKKAVPK